MEGSFEDFPGKKPAEQQPIIEHQTELIAAAGLGFGEGPISVVTRIEDPEDPLTRETIDKVHEVVNSDEILVPIEADDDGCGDGRGVKRIFQAVKSTLKRYKRSLNRSKVFGGGLMMGVAARIGLGLADDDLKDVFADEAEQFDQTGINYGVHTAENSPKGKSGCGAIDLAPENAANAVKYRDRIEQTVTELGGYIFGEDETEGIGDKLSAVLDNFAEYARNHPNEDHSGEEIINTATKNEKVVKELDDDEGHREVAVVLNFVEGMTVNQKLVRKATDNTAQAFAVDIPRIVYIAKKRYSDPDERKQAILSMLVYTLSTATTLTDGSLPVYVVRPKAG